MYYPDYEEASRYEKDYNIIPVCREIYADVVTPITLLRKLAHRQPFLFVGKCGGRNQVGQILLFGGKPADADFG